MLLLDLFLPAMCCFPLKVREQSNVCQIPMLCFIRNNNLISKSKYVQRWVTVYPVNRSLTHSLLFSLQLPLSLCESRIIVLLQLCKLFFSNRLFFICCIIYLLESRALCCVHGNFLVAVSPQREGCLDFVSSTVHQHVYSHQDKLIQADQTLLKLSAKMLCSLIMICRIPLPVSCMQLHSINGNWDVWGSSQPLQWEPSSFFILSSSDCTYSICCNQVSPRLLLNEVRDTLIQISDPSLISFCLWECAFIHIFTSDRMKL